MCVCDVCVCVMYVCVCGTYFRFFVTYPVSGHGSPRPSGVAYHHAGAVHTAPILFNNPLMSQVKRHHKTHKTSMLSLRMVQTDALPPIITGPANPKTDVPGLTAEERRLLEEAYRKGVLCPASQNQEDQEDQESLE